MRFHLDENTDHAIARALQQRGIDVTTSTDAGLIGADDLQQLEYAAQAGRVVFTQDADFLRHHQQGHPTPASSTLRLAAAMWAKSSGSFAYCMTVLIRKRWSIKSSSSDSDTAIAVIEMADRHTCSFRQPNIHGCTHG